MSKQVLTQPKEKGSNSHSQGPQRIHPSSEYATYIFDILQPRNGGDPNAWVYARAVDRPQYSAHDCNGDCIGEGNAVMECPVGRTQFSSDLKYNQVVPFDSCEYSTSPDPLAVAEGITAKAVKDTLLKTYSGQVEGELIITPIIVCPLSCDLDKVRKRIEWTKDEGMEVFEPKRLVLVK